MFGGSPCVNLVRGAPLGAALCLRLLVQVYHLELYFWILFGYLLKGSTEFSAAAAPYRIVRLYSWALSLVFWYTSYGAFFRDSVLSGVCGSWTGRQPAPHPEETRPDQEGRPLRPLLPPGANVPFSFPPMRLEFSEPLLRKRFIFSIQVPKNWCLYLQTHRSRGRAGQTAWFEVLVGKAPASPSADGGAASAVRYLSRVGAGLPARAVAGAHQPVATRRAGDRQHGWPAGASASMLAGTLSAVCTSLERQEPW